MKRLMTGIQPSGEITIGNYIGVIKNIINYQDDYELYIMIADLHAITVPQERELLRNRIIDLAALYIACGVDKSKVTMFVQSEVPAHSELAWILQCNSMFGELSRMTQFKEKSVQHSENISGGLFSYPALMAADLLLYDTNVTPVGIDQKQHVELTHTVAKRFNYRYGDIFCLPQPLFSETGSKIMDLRDPTIKMSKSAHNPNGYIRLLDEPSVAKKKIMSAVTDTGTDIIYDSSSKPGISNLLEIYSALGNTSIESLQSKYENKGYGEFKRDLSDLISNFLENLQSIHSSLISSGEIDELLNSGCVKATKISNEKIKTVKNAIGLGR